MRSPRSWIGLAACLLLVPAVAYAQDAAPRFHGLVWGGDATATISRADGVGFFNYTSYEQDTLRLARLRLFVEATLPGRVDVLAEARAENDTAELPTVFVRWQPSSGLPLYLQAGRIPLVIGAFSRRAYGSDNLVIGLPLAYQYLTSLRPDALPSHADDVLRMRARGWLSSFPLGNTTPEAGIPLIALETADTGLQAHWQAAHWSASAAVTVGTPADPRVRDNNGGPTWSARLARSWPAGVVAGASLARGPWIDRDVTGVAGPTVAQTLAGLDVELARGRWIVRGEAWRSTFGVPTLQRTLRAHSAFLEGRYRWHPRWHVAARVDRQTFSPLAGSARTIPWDANVWRIEGVVGYRVSRRLEVRAGWQHNVREAGRVRDRGFPAAQALFWF